MEEEGAGLKMWGLLSFWNVELCHRLMIVFHVCVRIWHDTWLFISFIVYANSGATKPIISLTLVSLLPT